MQLNLEGLLCPMPVIKTQEAVSKMKNQENLEVICSDPGALCDIPSWCKIHGHEVLQAKQKDNKVFIKIKIHK